MWFASTKSETKITKELICYCTLVELKERSCAHLGFSEFCLCAGSRTLGSWRARIWKHLWRTRHVTRCPRTGTWSSMFYQNYGPGAVNGTKATVDLSRIHPSVRSSAPLLCGIRIACVRGPDAGGYLQGSAQVPFGSLKCGCSSHPPLFVA